MKAAAVPPTTDLVVVLPGIMGSMLGRTTSDRPAAENLVWAPTGGAATRAIRNLLGESPRLGLPDGIGDDHPGDGVEAVALMPDVHVVPGVWTPIRGYDLLIERLNRLGYQHRPSTRPPNLLPLPYDWRLSCRYNGQWIARYVEDALSRWQSQGGQYVDAKIVFICHSMGGLVARWYIEKRGGADQTRKLITLGTPWRGATMAVDRLCNGVPIKIGPFAKLRMDSFARSLVGLHQLLPEFACIAGQSELLKITETEVPHLNADRASDALRFQTDLQAAERARPASRSSTHMIIGTRQPTITTAAITGEGVELSELFGTTNEYGDGTVPVTGAVGLDEAPDSNLLRRVADMHGNLQCNSSVFDEIVGIITATTIRRRDVRPYELSVRVPELLIVGEDLRVDADFAGDYRAGLKITVSPEQGQPRVQQPRVLDRHATAVFSGLPPGCYTVTVAGTSASSTVAPVTAATVILEPLTEL
jgi:pimeloyl-ACP methyl ester carboxylesterase